MSITTHSVLSICLLCQKIKITRMYRSELSKGIWSCPDLAKESGLVQTLKRNLVLFRPCSGIWSCPDLATESGLVESGLVHPFQIWFCHKSGLVQTLQRNLVLLRPCNNGTRFCSDLSTESGLVQT